MPATTTPRTSCEWISRTRDRLQENVKKQLPSEEILDHPLKPLVVTMSETRIVKLRTVGGSTTSSTRSSTPTPTQSSLAYSMDPLGALEGSDPLSQLANQQKMDPLSAMAAESWVEPVEGKRGKENVTASAGMDDGFQESWASRKAGILCKFTTSEKLSIVTSFLSGGEKVVVKAQSSVVDKVRTRLEQLDDFEEGSVRQMLDLSQQEYMGRIEQLNSELVQAWHQDQRVKALKIAIQCSKLLVDTSVIQFYPSKFVLISDILDIFGKLVYERLRTKSDYCAPGSKVPTPLPENFTPDMVPESAKETCRNWFYKIASIRELVPRLYVEMAILKSYSFLTSGEFSQGLLRLTRMIRGIGDPLVAVYARCYLCRVGLSINSSDRVYLRENFYDFLSIYNQLFSPSVRMDLTFQKVDLSTYLTLYTPALDYILQSVAHDATEKTLADILDRCKQKCNSALLFNTIMAAFKPAYIAARATQFVELLTSCDEEGFPKYLLFRTLGLCLTLADPPTEYCLQILNDVWKIVSKLTDPAQYICCAEVWVQYVAKHLSTREVNTFLGDIIKHMSVGRAYESHYSSLQTVMERVLSHANDFETLLTMDKFLPMLDIFQKESVKVDVCKSIMSHYTKHYQYQTTNDPVITNALMFICRVMHDSVNALTVEDEKRQIGNLICNFVKRVDFGRDFEQQLSFYVEARASFTNLDVIHAQLVQSVNRLAVDTRCIVKGHHTRKTASFVHACAAYCYITIPSISSVLMKLELYLLSGQVALLNQCLGQADACLKAALSLIADVPKIIEIDGKQKSSEPYIVSYICNFLSTLLIVPDSPEQGVLYLTRGLLNVIQNYSWDPQSAGRATVYLYVLDMLSTAAQESYPYHIDMVDSNDVLYGSDPKFIAELNRMCSVVVEEILSHLQYLGKNELFSKQSSLALDLLIRIATKADLSKPDLATLALNLWNLSQKHGCLDVKLAVRTTEYLKKKFSGCNQEYYAEFISRLKIKSQVK
ncbi:hypothetical protein FOCC_FOCC013650 [Frankliniella occidentalis]|uniref:VPS35 endosomal protein-sorting factor-like n=1 Tax=Frankliniella occidentalis TaxID=133901 RepID=A0A6J1SSP8_FRAOC|nr:VPS35 endosomal protein-sorting factor-like [Frankliniella occidentalis]KAE8740858.1 hypothetical protein FOCC_FOCC013650 [Frankliniella occidentalis]